MGFAIELAGVQQVVDAFAARLAVVDNLAPDLTQAADEFGRVESDLFDSQGHGNWAADTPATQAYKAQQRFGSLTLERTLQLRGSLEDPTVFEQTPTSVLVGTAEKAAKFQQEGFRQVWGLADDGSGLLHLEPRNNPYQQDARPPIDLDADDRRRIAQALIQSLLARLGGTP